MCESFDEVRGEFGPFERRLGMQAMFDRDGWRRVRGNRFVPPGADARSHVFVEWRREDGQWVVSAFGDEEFYFPKVLGSDANSIARDTALVAEDAAFAPEDWYTITVGGWRSPRTARSGPSTGPSSHAWAFCAA